MRVSTGWTRPAQGLLLALVVVNLYRAATQSLTTDEAFTYNHFVAPTLAHMLGTYDANHHILHSLLAKLSVTLFGLSELTLRLPSVLGGALYFAAVYRLSRRLFGTGWLFFAAVATLCLNPFVLDFLSAARGYGMAMAFWLWATGEMLACLMDGVTVPRLYRAGIALGLAVAANLVFLVPSAAFALVFAACLRRDLARLADHFIIPGVVTAFLIVVLPASRATSDLFYYGSSSLYYSLTALADLSFRAYVPEAPQLAWYSEQLLPRITQGLKIMALALPVLALCHGRRNRAGLLFGAGAFLMLGAVVAAHIVSGTPYPLNRTALYWIPVFSFCGFLVFDRYRRHLPVRVAGVAVIVFCICQFLLEFNVRYYAEWRHDAGTRRIVDLIRARQGGRVRVAASWVMEPTLNFYRGLYHLTWDPVDRSSLDRPADYRILAPADREFVGKLGLSVLYEDPVSHAVLAK